MNMRNCILFAIDVVLLGATSAGYASEALDAVPEFPGYNPAQVTKEYPPYPDVWHYVAAEGDEDPSLFWLTPSGDVLLDKRIHVEKIGAEQVWSTSTLGFFSGARYRRMTETDREGRGLVLINDTDPLALANGNFISSHNASGAKCSSDFSNYVVLTDPSGDTVGKYRLLWVLDKPIYDEGSSCEGDDPREIRVVALYPQFYALEDDTFLAAARNVALRFRADLSTGSTLLNERLFIVSAEVDPYAFVGKDPKMERSRVTDQEAWYEYLMKLKGEQQGNHQ